MTTRIRRVDPDTGDVLILDEQEHLIARWAARRIGTLRLLPGAVPSGAGRTRVRGKNSAHRFRVGRVPLDVCPCCFQEFGRRAGIDDHPDDMRTRGHLRPVHSHDHGPEELRSPLLTQEQIGRRLWVYQCLKCNSDQGGMNLRQWHQHLRAVFDPRVEAVELLLEDLRSAGVPESRF